MQQGEDRHEHDVEVERRRQRRRRLAEQLQTSDLLLGLCGPASEIVVEPGVLDGDRRVVREGREDLDLVAPEVGPLADLGVEHPDDRAVEPQRYGDLGHRAGHAPHVVGVRLHVGDERELAVTDGAPGDSPSDRPLERLEDVRVVAARPLDSQRPGRLVEQQDRASVQVEHLLYETQDRVEQLADLLAPGHRLRGLGQLRESSYELLLHRASDPPGFAPEPSVVSVSHILRR